MEYNGVGKSSATPDAAFVGKGVTFDTGGISIKPGAGMEDMKFDMAGSAAVVGLMKALADRGAKVHVLGAIGLAENMLSEKSYRPSDVLKSYSGQTIEVINTDAEGRLVLADTLTYVQRKYQPKTVIDLATLTGAMLIALGHEYAGAFCTTDALYADLEAAGERVEEYVWRMPLSKEYDKMLESPIADMRNLANGRWAGSCTAAAFLQRFVEGETEWAHIDIAGTAWRTAPRSFAPKGATGYGVRLLNEFVKSRYES
jgi:leucyl aminopeptidase